MNTTLNLDRIAAQVQEAQDGAGAAWQLTQRFAHATTNEARSELVTAACLESKRALGAARQALGFLEEAGAILPGRAGAAPKPEANPLADLMRVEKSRSESLALLDSLRRSLELAQVLDEKRGDDMWRDRLSELVASLELELYGPGEAVTGARE